MGDLQQACHVDRGFHMIGERVERRLDALLITKLAIPRTAEARQILAPERIRCEKTVEMATGNAAIPGDRAIAALAQAQHRPREAWAGHAADMHLKTLDGRTAG